MRLRKCEWANCVWEMNAWKEYRIGDKKARFIIFEKDAKRYTCEGCVRQIIKSDYDWLIKIKPLTKKAEKILVLLRLE